MFTLDTECSDTNHITAIVQYLFQYFCYHILKVKYHRISELANVNHEFLLYLLSYWKYVTHTIGIIIIWNDNFI